MVLDVCLVISLPLNFIQFLHNLFPNNLRPNNVALHWLSYLTPHSNQIADPDARDVKYSADVS